MGTGPARARPARVLLLAPESGLRTLAIAGLLLSSAAAERGLLGFTAAHAARERVAILGSGSDYTVFFNHIGVPSADLVFDGPYGVYHSIYDSHEWMRRVGDPGFRYHAAMARRWGLHALRLANADVLPLDYGAYGRDLLVYLDDVTKLGLSRGVDAGLDRARQAAQALSRLGVPEPTGDAAVDAARSRALVQAERDLLSADGIPDRPWFRHLVYAPLPSYEAETLPGVREAILAADAARAREQAARLAGALERAARTLGAPPP